MSLVTAGSSASQRLAILAELLNNPIAQRAGRRIARGARRAFNRYTRRRATAPYRTSYPTRLADSQLSTLSSRSTRYGNRAQPDVMETGQAYERQDQFSADTRYLYSAEVNFPSTSDVTNINAHPDLIHLSGIKACYMFENRQDKPFEVHFAIIQPKNAVVSGQQDLELALFRDNTLTARSYSDFTENNSQWDLRYLCAGINHDKWNVITHTKRILWPKNSDTATGTGTYFWKHEKYYNIQRRIRFDRTFNTGNTAPFVILVWVVELHKEDAPYAGDPPGYVPYSNAIDVQTGTTTYWKNSLHSKLGMSY